MRPKPRDSPESVTQKILHVFDQVLQPRLCAFGIYIDLLGDPLMIVNRVEVVQSNDLMNFFSHGDCKPQERAAVVA